MKQFWIHVIKSFNVFAYRTLSGITLKKAIIHFFTLFTIIFTAGLLLYIPILFSMPGNVMEQFTAIDTFTVDVTLNTSTALSFPQHKPIVSIADHDTQPKEAPITIQGESLKIKPMPGISYTHKLQSDVAAEGYALSRITIFIALFLAPSIIFYLYLFAVLKYALIAGIATLIVRVSYAVMRKSMPAKKIFIAALFSLTPLMILDAILRPFAFPTFFIPLILYALWFGMIAVEMTEEF